MNYTLNIRAKGVTPSYAVHYARLAATLSEQSKDAKSGGYSGSAVATWNDEPKCRWVYRKIGGYHWHTDCDGVIDYNGDGSGWMFCVFCGRAIDRKEDK